MVSSSRAGVVRSRTTLGASRVAHHVGARPDRDGAHVGPTHDATPDASAVDTAVRRAAACGVTPSAPPVPCVPATRARRPDRAYRRRHGGPRFSARSARTGHRRGARASGGPARSGWPQAGADVVVLDRDAEAAKAVAGEVGGTAVAVDLSDLDAVDALDLDVDVLVNNAGLQHVAPVHEFPVDRFSYILRLMLEAPFRLARGALPHMYERGWGRVVNISSDPRAARVGRTSRPT